MPLPPLAALLPAHGPDEILDRFVGWASAAGLVLYPAQEEAILELLGGKHLVLSTPTGSGKSLVAFALHFKAMAEGKVSYYTCPIKALVNEKFFALCQAFGPENVGMSTGDASINRGAPIVCCTAEVLMNLVLRESEPRVDSVVMDEFHYYADKERGVAWQVPLLSLPRATFLLMSATLGDTRAIEESLAALTGRGVAAITGRERPVPLDFEYRETPLHETIEALVAARKYPVYLVNFTQRAAAEQAQNLMSIDVCSREEKEALRQALDGARFDTPYGKDLQRFLRHGIGLHHAGLLPKYRLLVEKLAQAGQLKIVSGTDTLGAGVNLPIRTVLFTQLYKYDGERTRVLSVRDFLQIAGRAGRKGFDDRGSVVAQAPEHVVENKKLLEKKAAGKKVVKRPPPEKGYVHYDRSTFDRLVSGAPEPLESRFQVTHGMLLNILQAEIPERRAGYRRLVELIARSHGNEWSRRQARRAAAVCFRSLRGAGLLQLVPGPRGPLVVMSAELQRDFSLHTTLALYLIDTLARLDPASESYALDLLTLVESILENPEVVLYKQLDKLKTEKVAEMKAQGVEYEQRMAELEKMEWPKPNRDFIYATFNEFAAKRPWLGEENIRPKSIAREMLERFCSFHDYVRDYGLQRSEGVLLRYLSEVYKTLLQTVPAEFRNEGVEDLIAQLRITLRSVDSSLLDEWERMKDPLAPIAAAPERPREPESDPRAFAARVRAELHRLLKALAEKRYEEAAACVRDGAWTAQELEREMEPYWAEHASISTLPAARKSEHTFLRAVGPGQWEARQRIVDPEGDLDWMLDCMVDQREARAEDAPLIELRRIGI